MPRVINGGARKAGYWRDSEDTILTHAVLYYGRNQWSLVSQFIIRKDAEQCRARWFQWLEPRLKAESNGYSINHVIEKEIDYATTTPETRPARPDTPIDKNEIIKRFVEEDRKRANRENAQKEGSARTLEVVLRKRRKLNKDFTPITCYD